MRPPAIGMRSLATTDLDGTSQDGRIITFYSFKGGVGRTMALANVAFLAAVNGKRVLVMDWDLEAPGLHYYFRGMQDAATARALRSTPGILDLAWSWRTGLHQASTAEEMRTITDHYVTGVPFEAMVCSLVPEDDDIGILHYIGAGGSTIATPEPLAYEEALARFDWSTFFTEEAGGIMLAALRSWAKTNYDYIFLDSRTGFADVAGICTVQIPDQVALCYIYNRQNIDGIAQVAGAIRERRGDAVELRAVPMRVARENTSEEADARARARKELTRKGGFSSEAVEHDQRTLAIRQAPNVPFYEAIALITSDRPRSDPLVLDYLNLAGELLGTDLAMPQIYEGWVDRVRLRLQPRQAAPDYLIDLRNKDYSRALEEVTQLVQKALEDQIDGDEDDYFLKTLIATVMHLSRSSTSDFDTLPMMSLTLDLLRALAASNPSQWKMEFGDFITFYLEQMQFSFDEDDELLLLDELDSILASQPSEEAIVRRLDNRRRAARLHLMKDHVEATVLIIAELGRLIDDARGRFSSDNRLDLLAADIDLWLLKGDMQLRHDKAAGARRQFEKGLAIGTHEEIISRPDLMRLRFDLNLRLARMMPPVLPVGEAARYAMDALNWSAASNAIVFSVPDLGEAVVRAGDPTLLVQFLRQAFQANERRQTHVILFHGRSPRAAYRLTRFIGRALILLKGEEPGSEWIALLFDMLFQTIEMFRQRPSSRANKADHDLVRELDRIATHVGNHPTQLGQFGTRIAELTARLGPDRIRRTE